MKLSRYIFSQELHLIFICPALLWQIVFLFVPLIMLLFYSVIDYLPSKNSVTITLAYYTQIFDSLYFPVILRSFWLALVTASICLLIAYPVAYYLAMKGPKRFKTFLLFSLILPSWTSLIVQIYAWFFLLEKNGFVSRALQTIGIISAQTHLLNNYFAIIMGMISCYLPFMILPLYAVLEKIDKRYLEASADLGANRVQTFKRIVVPLSLPGVYAGFMLVFIPAFGEFAIPLLLGGSKHLFWGSVIVDKFLQSRDWHSGAALTLVGIMLPITLLVTFYLIKTMTNKMRERNNVNVDYHRNHPLKDSWT